MTTLGLGLLADGLAIRDAHGHQSRVNAGLLLQAGEEHVHLRLAHGMHDGLMRLLVARDLERGVRLSRARQERAQLVLLILVDRFDSHRIERLGQLERHDGDIALHRERIPIARL